MKRSILIGALAALMLFAFVACEPATIEYPTENGKEIANITVTSATVYAGQTYSDAVPAIVSVVYRDGSTTENVAAELTVSGTPVAGQNFGTVTYSGLTTSAGQPGSWRVGFNAIAVTGAELSVAEDDLEVEYTALASDCAITGDIALTYANGTVISMKDVELDWNSTTQANITAVTTTVPATITGAEDIVLSADLTITGKPAATPVTLSSIAIEYTVEGEEVSTVAANTYFYGDTVTWKVVGTYSDGSKKDLTASEYYVKDQKTLPASTLTLTDKALDSVTIMAVEDIAKTATLSIPAGKNYITAVTAITPKTQGGPTAGATNVTIASYDVTVTTAFDDKGATKFDTTNATILDPTAPSEGVYAPRFEVKFGKNNAEKTVITAGSVTFPAAE